VPVTIPDSTVFVPEPVNPPGLMVHVALGKPLNATLPVATAQVGWVIVPTIGAVGVTGCRLMIIWLVGDDVQPIELVTV
jgi:hypothetical protein